MGISTLDNKHGAALKPRKETIQFILNYSRALEVVRLKDNPDIDLIKN